MPHLEPPVHLSAEGALWEPMAESSELFSESQAHALIEQLPPRFRQSHWRLLYGTSRHGISLQVSVPFSSLPYFPPIAHAPGVACSPSRNLLAFWDVSWISAGQNSTSSY